MAFFFYFDSMMLSRNSIFQPLKNKDFVNAWHFLLCMNCINFEFEEFKEEFEDQEIELDKPC